MLEVLTDTAETVLKRRYYLKDEEGNCIEAWPTLCRRVAKHVANGDAVLEEEFFWMINELYFLPNSPCLMNSGNEIGQLAACFSIGVGDSMEEIFQFIKEAALIFQSGGGVGTNWSEVRAKGSPVKSTQGVASGVLSFMNVFNEAVETIKQGGKRRGAAMSLLNIDHPEVEDFIRSKTGKNKLNNMNLSVGVTDEFMLEVKSGNRKSVDLFNLIADTAHSSAEPGFLFLSTMESANPTPHLGRLDKVNPCAEVNLLSDESCNLGSINLSKFVSSGSKEINYSKLEEVVRLAVNFLDNVVSVNKFPLEKIKVATLKTRKIGLGFAGLHDFLIKLELPYDSDEGRLASASIMRFIEKIAVNESEVLAKTLGVFPAYAPEYCRFPPRRNAALTCLAPTGSLSMFMDVSSGIEPYFSIVTVKSVMDNDKFIMSNKLFKEVAEREGFYSDELMLKVSESGTVLGHDEIPEKWQQIFKTAMDISPENHIRMQAVVQNNGIHNAISKTTNLPRSATVEDVKGCYMLAWELGCKGVTVYVDGSYDNQVLTSGSNMTKPTATVSADGPVKQDLPDTLRARRYKLKLDDGENVYIIICFSEDGKPMEVFAKFPYDGRHEYREKSTAYTTVCRLVSLALRYSIPVEEVIKQLDKSSGSMMDLPAQLTKLLKTFLSETNSPYTVPCPECGEPTLVFEEGCQVCKSCGYSKCS